MPELEKLPGRGRFAEAFTEDELRTLKAALLMLEGQRALRGEPLGEAPRLAQECRQALPLYVPASWHRG